MNVIFKENFEITLVIFITFVIVFTSCNRNKEEKTIMSKDVCEEKLPPFSEKFNNQYNDIKLKELCKCIWNKFPINGWERKVSEKLYEGEDIGWKIKGFSTIFENNLKNCRKEMLRYNND